MRFSIKSFLSEGDYLDDSLIGHHLEDARKALDAAYKAFENGNKEVLLEQIGILISSASDVEDILRDEDLDEDV